MTELKPCPFCSGKAEITKDLYYGLHIVCKNCSIGTIAYPYENDDLFDDWNTRAETPEREALVELVDIVEEGYAFMQNRFDQEKQVKLVNAWMAAKEALGDE